MPKETMMNTLLKLSARVLKSALAGNRSLPDHCRSMSSLPLKMAAAAFLAGVCAAWSVPAAWAQVGFAGAQVTVGGRFENPEGVAVDTSGNVFVADTGKSTVKEILAVNGSIPADPTINTLGSGFGPPFSVAVDGSGNVYV